MDKPYLIEFKSHGSSELGFISVAEEHLNIPFNIKRVYWTYFTPQSVLRGGHANIEKEMFLVAVAGNIRIHTEIISGEKSQFYLDQPNIGLYLPKLCWHSMQYSHSAVQMVLASNFYSESDYIRDYEQFKARCIYS
jgi:hypothetical protein